MKALLQNRAARKVAMFFLVTGLIWAFAGPAHAQATRAAAQSQAQTRQAETGADANAEHVREQLVEILQKYSPTLGQILRLDSSLMSREDYMASYPALVAFLEQHPEIRRNPSYYLQRYADNYSY